MDDNLRKDIVGKGPETKKGESVVCEFFGIKITTRNPNIARILQTDVGEIANLEIREIKDFIAGDDEKIDGEKSKA